MQEKKYPGLIPMNERSPEFRREAGRKGGLRSGELKRRRKRLKEELLVLLEEGNTQERVCSALIQAAEEGSPAAFRAIADTIGEGAKLAVELEAKQRIEAEDLSSLSAEELDALAAAMGKCDTVKDTLALSAKEALAQRLITQSLQLEQKGDTDE